jgi:hypothetical protein
MKARRKAQGMLLEQGMIEQVYLTEIALLSSNEKRKL